MGPLWRLRHRSARPGPDHLCSTANFAGSLLGAAESERSIACAFQDSATVLAGEGRGCEGTGPHTAGSDNATAKVAKVDDKIVEARRVKLEARSEIPNEPD